MARAVDPSFFVYLSSLRTTGAPDIPGDRVPMIADAQLAAFLGRFFSLRCGRHEGNNDDGVRRNLARAQKVGCIYAPFNFDGA